MKLLREMINKSAHDSELKVVDDWLNDQKFWSAWMDKPVVEGELSDVDRFVVDFLERSSA